MKFAIQPTGHEPFITTNDVPEPLKEYHIPGSRVTSALGSFGMMLLQEVVLDDFGWQYLIFDVERDTTFQESFDRPVIIALVSLKGICENILDSIGNLKLTPHQFNIVSTTSYANSLHLEKGSQYILVRMLYPEQYVSYALSFFPALETFKTNVSRSKGSLLADRPVYAGAKILDSIYQLIHSFYSANVQLLHVTILKELLLSMLKHIDENHTDKSSFSLGYIERIHEAKEFIDANLPDHFSIGYIARQVGINDQKLKQGFKEIFGTGLYKYLQEQVLKIAKIQLEETDKPIKEIAFNAGYKSQGNFSSAFKKYYGLSPNNWRENFKRNG